MPWVGTVTVVGLVVLAALIWFFLRTRSQDLVAEIVAKRKTSSKLVSHAHYAESLARIPVAISLDNDTFYYENPDMQASFELAMIDEIEYDDELATGRSVEHGYRVLRLRSHGATFDFVLQPNDTNAWIAALPPRRLNDGEPAKQAV